MISPFEHSPWDFWTNASDADRDGQRELLDRLRATHPKWLVGMDCFISEHASVDNERLVIGDRSYIAAGAYLTGSLRAGADCSINPYTVVRGDVTLGDAVRIGAHTSILGFDHTMTDPGVPVFRQPLRSRGVTIGDDVWIGSHVVVLDGVSVGSHSVLAAGAVITKDVPTGAIVGGNPARLIRWRIPPTDAPVSHSHSSLESRAVALGGRARTQSVAILDRSWDAAHALFVDHPGAHPSVRAQCDAIEVADLLMGAPPRQLPRETLLTRLKEWQDPATGVIPPLDEVGRPSTTTVVDDPDVAYHVECVGYALGLLGAEFSHSLQSIVESSAVDIAAFCDALPWESRAWHAGHWVDSVGTALHFSLRRGDAVPSGLTEALFGWLLTHADPQTGMWGRPDTSSGFLQVVNGFYRTTRGTFAQFGVPVPYPARVIDTVLLHARDPRAFASEHIDACTALDVAHPLWLTRSTDHRPDEVRNVARMLLDTALSGWMDDAGFAFQPGAAQQQPGLKGTEMWLATIWYLCDILGFSAALGFRPRGIHRPEPAASLLR